MKKIHLSKYIVVLALSMLMSCGQFGLIQIVGYYNDFESLDQEQKQRVRDLDGFDNLEQGLVYKINPLQLKAELANHPRSLVYVYSVGCDSSVCKPLAFYERYAEQKGYDVFFVMRSYYSMPKSLEQQSVHPLFVIDDSFYHERRRFVYERYFVNDMLGIKTETKYKDVPIDLQGSFLFFERDKLVKVANKLEL